MLLQFFCGIDGLGCVSVPSKSTLQRYDTWWRETQVRQLVMRLLQTGAQSPEKLYLPEAVDLETCF